MATSFGGTIKLTGESEYRKALRDITTNLKEVSSELKLTNTQFASGDKTVKETKTAYTNMNTTMQEQKGRITELKTIISQMTKEYNEHQSKLVGVEEQYGKNSKEASEYRNRLENTENQLKTFKTQLNNAETQLVQMENVTDKSNKELKEMKNGFDDAGQGAIKFGDLLKANVLGDFITSGLKAMGSVIKQVGATLLSVGKDALDSYADYEQLVGGVETLFKDNANVVEQYANNAYKTAGLSANDYMETVTSFSASLLQSLNGDTAKAADVSNRAIVDMADNANKMGTDMVSIQNAYQGFAKQNYTMLDNLKLGYGGTKEEMQRLIKDASKMKDVQKELGVTVDSSSMSFGNIVNAISVMQKKMDIAGTTSKEASTTIQGSVSSMKSAWQNMLTGIATGNAENIGNLISNLVDSVLTAGQNILPRVQEIANGVIEVIPQLLSNIRQNMPFILEAGVQIINTLIEGIRQNLYSNENGMGIIATAITIMETFFNGIIELLPNIVRLGGEILLGFISGISESIPDLLDTAINIIFELVDELLDNFDVIVDTGIELISSLIFGIVDALPQLIEKAPEIIEKLVQAIADNLPKILQAGVTLITKMGEGLIKAVPQLISKIPEIMGSLVKGFKNYFSNMKDVGKNLVSGIWEGIKNAKNWLLNKVKEWCGNILNGIKSFFGIHSPSKVFKDEIGTNLALGVGEGFSNTMKDVSTEMKTAIPTEFDVTSTTINKTDTSNKLTLENMTSAFVTAINKMNAQIIIDKDVAGRFVITTVNDELGELM